MGTPIRKDMADHMGTSSTQQTATLTIPKTSEVVNLDWWMVKLGGTWVNQSGDVTPQYLSNEYAGVNYGGNVYRTFIGHRARFGKWRIRSSPSFPAYPGSATWWYPKRTGSSVVWTQFTPRAYTDVSRVDGLKETIPTTEFFWDGYRLMKDGPEDWEVLSLFGSPGFFVFAEYGLPTAVGSGNEAPQGEIFDGSSRVIQRVSARDVGGDGSNLRIDIYSDFSTSGSDLFLRHVAKPKAGTKDLNVDFPGGLTCLRDRNVWVGITSDSTVGVGTRRVSTSFTRES